MAINQPGPAKNCSLNINSHQVGGCNRWRHCKPDITTSKWPKERFYDISSISVFFCKLKDLTQAINRSQSGSRNYYVLIGICVQENRKVIKIDRVKILLSLELEFSWWNIIYWHIQSCGSVAWSGYLVMLMQIIQTSEIKITWSN